MTEVTEIRTARAADVSEVLELYRRVARMPGGLARLEDEVSHGYVEGFLNSALERGMSFVAVSGDRVLGEIHACSPSLYCFAHVLGDLTIAVDLAAQGQGLGRALFARLMREVIDERPDIERVELIARETNVRAIRFYESLGFEREGLFRQRIRNLDGSVEADVPMAWIRDPERLAGKAPDEAAG